MALTRIKVSFGVTLNTGNYESIRVDCGSERDLAPNEDFAEAYKADFIAIKKLVNHRAEVERKRVMGE